MTEDELSAELAKMEAAQPKYLRPYVREHFEEIARLKRTHTMQQIAQALANIGVVDANKRPPSPNAVHAAYNGVEHQRNARRPKAEPQRGRPRHSSEVEF